MMHLLFFGAQIAQTAAHADAAVTAAPAWVAKSALIVSICSFCASAFGIFLTTQQKQNERRFAFYSDRAISPCLETLDQFSQAEREHLTANSEDELRAMRTGSVEKLAEIFTRFSKELYSASDSVFESIAIFDANAAQKIVTRLRDFDTAVTKWIFTDPSPSQKELRALFTDMKRDVFRYIYHANFELRK